MEKLKSLRENQVAYSVHGVSSSYENTIKEFIKYNEKLKEIADKKERTDFKKNAPKKEGSRFTLSAVVDKKTGEGYIGIAICDPNDNFSRKLGRAISIDRAIVYKNNEGEIKSGKPIVKFEIKEINKKDEKSIRRELFDYLIGIRNVISEDPIVILDRNNKKVDYPLTFEKAKVKFQKLIESTI